MKKLMIFTREYPPNIIGGTSIIARLIAKGLSNLDYDVTVVTSVLQKNNKVEIVDGIKIIGIAADSIYSSLETSNLRYYKNAISYLSKVSDKPDVVLFPDLFSYPAARLYSKINKIPLVNILLQDFNKLLLYDKHNTHKVTNNINATASELFRIEEKALLSSDRNVFISYALSSSICNHYKLNREKCSVIYVGIDEKELAPNVNLNYQAIRDSLCPKEKKLIMSIGRLVPFKGFDSLIKAFKLINDTYNDTFLCILGSGPEESYLRELISDLNLEESVKILYEANRAKTVSYLNVCDIAVVPSLWESFCLVAVEFMALGKPFVASGVDSLNEIIVHGESGLLCTVEEENNKRHLSPQLLAKNIEALLLDHNLAEYLASNAKKRVKMFFTEEICTQNFARLIDTLQK